MNVLDALIGIILLIFALAGLRKGLIIEAFYLASIILGIYGAMSFSDSMADRLSEIINIAPEYLALIGFILTFILFMVVIRYLGRLVSRLVETINLGFLDKIGGLLFGAFKGVLLVSITIMLFNMFNISEVIDKEKRNESLLYTRTENIANTLYKNHDLIKESMKRSFDRGADFFEESVEKVEDIMENNLTK